MMDRLKLSRIDEELDSSEVASLCFLCSDVVTRKRLEGVQDAKQLFLRLEERGLLDNGIFLSQLLHTIGRADLLSLLETDSRRPEEMDANPLLSAYRVMLYETDQNMTQMNFDKMVFLLDGKLDKRQLEKCKTAMDVFAEMERRSLLSNQKLDLLLTTLQEFDQQLAATVQRHMQGLTQPVVPPHISMDYQRVNDPPQAIGPPGSITDTQSSYEEEIFTDADPVIEPPSLPDETDYYPLIHNPRGQCVVFNNEIFSNGLGKRAGSEKDEEALRDVFGKLGFTVNVHHNLTADDMLKEVNELSQRSFLTEDVLVVCVLSHGELGSVYGTDEKEVPIKKLTVPFTSGQVPSLAGKPKLFFIQACQGSGYQRGSVPVPPRPSQQSGVRQSRLEEDAGRIQDDTVPWDADFLLGMATVPACKSFRNTSTGSIYIQELCRQLHKSARSQEMDDVLSMLTRVNRMVSKGVFLNHKQMPEPKYTLTKKLVLKYV
ncbi:caspase-8 [Notolabrus celidotus]|uniref:caspase-8 n=1 Tax=Notolabrus celidotus TaxID=1203425 RepID=UPI00148F8A77|nr:caspase-8 [Notolabrus celidotus]